MRVTEHLYIYFWENQRENNCNSIFIDGKVPLLIDPGHAHHAPSLFSRMIEDGVSPSGIMMVLCTHAHPDHFGGTLAFRDSPARIAISRQEEQFIETVGKALYAEQGKSLPSYRVDFHVAEGDLQIGKHQFQVFLTPGHSPGSLSLYWPRHKVLITGDVVFMQGVGRADLPGGNSADLVQSVERLSKLPTELLIPGHGPAVQGADEVQRNFQFVKKAFLNKS